VNFLWLGAILALAFYALGSLAGSALSALLFALRIGRRDGRARPGLLLGLRLLPTGSGMAAAGLAFLPAWWTFERRDTTEVAGPVVLALAALSTVSLGTGMVRLHRAWAATRRRAASWRGRAVAVQHTAGTTPLHEIEDPFPVVATVGVRRPRFFVARQVVKTCSEAELAAILAHERAHLRARDNLKGLLVEGCADPLWALGVARRMEEAWRQSVEKAADEMACRETPPVDLASAIVKVARLATERRSAPTVSAALHDGSPIADRVHALLDHSPRSRDRGTVSRRVIPAIAGASLLFLLRPETLVAVHQLAEQLIRL
jgi:Zn-dependent protease with chaperone function